MINDIFFKIKQNQLLYEYLKYHSYWYRKILNNELFLNDMIDEMKIELKITNIDKLNDLSNKIELISSFLSIIN